MPTREPWLGDALRALSALAPDDDATVRQILSMLSLPLAVPDAAMPTAPAPPPPRADKLETDVADVAGSQAPPAPPDDGTRGAQADAGRRLPSRLAALPAAEAPSPPSWLTSTPPLALAPSLARPAAAAPLMPRQRRRAILTALLHEAVEEGEPDVQRIVATLGRGRWLARVPRRLRRTLRHGVELRPDRAPWLRAFHADQTELREALTRLLPTGRVSSVPIDGAPEPRPGRRRLPARLADLSAAQRSTAPTPILLLSDLGGGYCGEGEPPASLRDWQAWFLRQRRAGRRSVVLSPLPLPTQTAFAATLMPWSERASIGDALRARAGQTPPPPELLTDEAMLALAQALSPALVISPALLRATRLALALPPAAEAELLANGPVASHGVGGTTFDAAAARELRRQLAQGERLSPALERVAAEGRQRQDGSAIEEALMALELQGRLDDSTAEQALQTALAALARGGAAAASVADWAAHAWTRMSPQARATQPARQLAFAAAREQLQAAQHPGGAAAATGWLAAGARAGEEAGAGLPVMAPWLGGSGSARLARSMELRRYADGSVNLLIGPEAASTQALHRIELPAAAPWLEIASGDARTVLALPDTGVVQFDWPMQSPDRLLTISAADGARWSLIRPPPNEMFAGSAFALPGQRGVALCLAPGMAFAARMPAPAPAGPPPSARKRAAPVPRPPLEAGNEFVFEAGDGTMVNVRVLEVLPPSGGVERLALAFTPPHALPPFDHQVRSEGGGDRLVTVDIALDAQPVDLRRVGDGYEAGFARREQLTPLVLLERADHGWAWVERVVESGGSKAPPRREPGAAVRIDSIESEGFDAMAKWLARSVRRQFSLWVLDTDRFGTDSAGYVFDQLRRRWPSNRVELLEAPPHDGAHAWPTSIVLILGSGRIDPAREQAALDVARSGGTLLWAPMPLLRDAPETGAAERLRLSQWAPELVDHVLRRQALDASRSIEALPEEVSRWLQGEQGDATPSASTAQSAVPLAEPPPTAAPPVAPTVRPATGSLRRRLVAMIESREERDLGLFRIDVRNGLALTPVSTLPTGRPLLLFVHGITGTTANNFGPLLADDPARAALLARTYGDAMFAWHYRSLSVGPLANAGALARALPAGARLHLVTYSAGGVIGELLCRGMRSDGRPPIDLHDLQRMVRPGFIDPSFEDDWAELNSELASRRLKIERFVRIAAPIEGSVVYGGGVRTTLKLARAVPWIGGIVAALPGVESLLTDPSVVPGAAAMAPGAGVQPLLTSDVRVNAPLSVIAGVHEAQSLGARASAWWAGIVGGADSSAAASDLWVSLPSALAGLEREAGIEYFIERGEQVDHANYLRLDSVRERVVAALLAERQPAPGFAFARSMSELKTQALRK